MIIAIDPGYTNLGYAVGTDGEIVEYGTLYFKDPDRPKEIYEKVAKIFKRHQPTRAIVEDFRVYKSDYRGKHKTAVALGIVLACAYDRGAQVDLIHYKTWVACFQRVYAIVYPRLSGRWKKALRKGSEDSRDAVMMLLPEVVSLRGVLI